MYGKSHIDGRHGREYLSYACTGRKHKQICNNREVRKEYIESYILKQLQVNLFSERSIKKLSFMLSDYSKRSKSRFDSEYNLAVQDLNEINRKINKIIELVSESGISIDTVKGELKQLEERKHQVENCIQDIEEKNNVPLLSEEMLTQMISQAKKAVDTGNILECREVIESFVQSILVYRDRVEVKFKISISDEDNDTLSPLTIEEKLTELKAGYQKVI
jgi:site-specific DNA recombinase